MSRHHLHSPLFEHLPARASALVNLEIRSITAASTYEVDEDQLNVDATGGAVVCTLPDGSDAIKGKSFAAVKTDGSANAVSLARSGSDTIEGGTSLSTTTQHDRLEVYWDGSMWRRSTTGTGGGSTSLGNTVIDGTLEVTGNTALDGTTTMGTGGSAAVFTPGASSLALAKSLDITGSISATVDVTAPLVMETQAAEAKAADTPFSIAAGDRMLTISTTGAGASAITAGDTLEVGQEVFILMTAFVLGTYTLALTGGLTATFGAVGDSLHIKHFGGGVWASMGGTAVVA